MRGADPGMRSRNYIIIVNNHLRLLVELVWASE